MTSQPTETTPVITIGTPDLTTNGRWARWSVRVEGTELPDELWYELPTQYADMLSERADAGLIALILPAMHQGASLCVEGALTDEVVFQFSDIQALYEAMGRGRARSLITRQVLPAAPPASGVATGFSGGIDSFSILAERYFASGVPVSHRLTHLLFNNVGSHGWGPGADDLGRARLDRLRPAIDQIGLPAVEVVSNLDAFFQPPLWFFATHTLRNASVAHVVSSGLSKWLYASAYEYRWVTTQTDTSATARADPFVLPLVSTNSLQLRDVGTRYSRVQKTEIVADIPLSWDYLDVCSDIDTPGAEQCSDCMKCRRTLMALDVLGVVERYSRIFDLAHWAEVRNEYLWDVLTTRSDPYKAELRRLVRERGVDVPWRVLFEAAPSAWNRLSDGYQWTRDHARRYARSARQRLRRPDTGHNSAQVQIEDGSRSQP